nr:BamA/TamA family outer membrane protein [Pseudenhygromyxa sp. WMMC2535]
MLLGACKPGVSASELRGAQYAIRKVRFEGTERFKDREIHDYLELAPSTWVPLPERSWYYEGLIPVDVENIVGLYHAYGYYEAAVVDVQVETNERKRRQDVVDILFVVEEGPVTKVTDVALTWPEGPLPGPDARARRVAFGTLPDLSPEAFEALVELEEGDPFEVPTFEADARSLRTRMKDLGHPYAEVRKRAVVDRAAKQARVVFELIPGPYMVIGPVTVTGLEHVPEPEVQVEVETLVGQPYSPRRVTRLERHVYDMGVFSAVSAKLAESDAAPEGKADEKRDADDSETDEESDADDSEADEESDAAPEGKADTAAEGEAKQAEPGTDEPEGDGVVSVSTDEVGKGDIPWPEVPVTLSVTESNPQRVRVGLGLGFESNRWDQRVSARYSHANLFGDLYKLTLSSYAGYAELPNPINLITHGPIAELGINMEKKGLLEKQLVWTGDLRVRLGIEQGYQSWSTEHRFGVSRFFTRWFQLELSHTLRYVDFFAISPTLAADDTFLGLDFRDPYILSYVDIGATIYAVDQISSPNSGGILGVRYRVAGGPFGGHYDYQEVEPFLRLYWRPIDRLQLAARARLGMIFPYGDEPGAPIDMRRYLGGSNSVRGWGLRRLSPRIDDCEDGEDPLAGDCDSIPVGGNSSVLGNLELRVRIWRELWVAAFLDGGDVQDGISTFSPQEWNYASGGGLRYDSPIGKLRLDVGVRLNETTLSEGEPIWSLHFGLGESF